MKRMSSSFSLFEEQIYCNLSKSVGVSTSTLRQQRCLWPQCFRRSVAAVNVHRCLFAVAADPEKTHMKQNRISYDTAITSSNDFLFAFPEYFHETIQGLGCEIRLIIE